MFKSKHLLAVLSAAGVLCLSAMTGYAQHVVRGTVTDGGG